MFVFKPMWPLVKSYSWLQIWKQFNYDNLSVSNQKTNCNRLILLSVHQALQKILQQCYFENNDFIISTMPCILFHIDNYFRNNSQNVVSMVTVIWCDWLKAMLLLIYGSAAAKVYGFMSFPNSRMSVPTTCLQKIFLLCVIPFEYSQRLYVTKN